MTFNDLNRVITSFTDSTRNWEILRSIFANPSSLTTSDTSTVDVTYGTQERDVIINLRTRVDELEARLQELGMLE